jgi:hypothetical protein
MSPSKNVSLTVVHSKVERRNMVERCDNGLAQIKQKEVLVKLFTAFCLVLGLFFLSSCASGGKVDKQETKGSTDGKQQSSGQTADLAQPDKKVAGQPQQEPVISIVKKRLTIVNVRPDPSTKRPPVAKLTGGDKVEVIGEVPGWLHIRFGNNGGRGEGWISKQLINKQ